MIHTLFGSPKKKPQNPEEQAKEDKIKEKVRSAGKEL